MHHIHTEREKQYSNSVRNKNLCPQASSGYDAVRLLLRLKYFMQHQINIIFSVHHSFHMQEKTPAVPQTDLSILVYRREICLQQLILT